VSDARPDCNQCSLESSYVELIDYGFNTSSFYSVVDDQLLGSFGFPDDLTRRVRGSPAGELTSVARPAKCVVHHEWCSHRPTMASVAVIQTTVSPNGAIRVFVEGARDFTKNVWAEMQYETAVPFPDRDSRNHYPDGIVRQGGPYSSAGPVFGIQNGTHNFASSGAQDGDGYTTSAWPLTAPITLAPLFGATFTEWSGTRLRIRWGYKNNGIDTVLGTRIFNATYSSGFESFGVGRTWNPPGTNGDTAQLLLGTLTIGCNWDDISTPHDSGQVRCGIEFSGGQTNYLGAMFTLGGFTIPFEMPRSFFVDSTVEVNPAPPIQYRFTGVEATAPRVATVIDSARASGTKTFVFGDSTNLDAYSHSSAVTVGARRAAVFMPASSFDETGTIPATLIGPSSVPQNPIELPLLVRRPDVMQRGGYHVPNGDSWHATHLVRFGSPLAGRNVLHNLNLNFEPCSFPQGVADAARHYSQGPIRTGLGIATGSNFLFYNIFFRGINVSTPGTTVFPDFASDVTFNPVLPPAFIWDAISGGIALSPYAPNGEALVPNSYQYFDSEALVTAEHDIETPQGYTGDGVEYSGFIGGPYSSTQVDPASSLVFSTNPTANENTYAQYAAAQVPARLKDYRAAWKIESYPQVWASTSLAAGFVRTNLQSISFSDSGMTTENFDRFSRSDVEYIPENCGVTINIRCRVGLKVAIARLKGFRRKRERQPFGIPNVFEYVATGDIEVYGDHSPGDVFCNEYVHEFSISLTNADVVAISSGQEVAKQVIAGTFDGVNVTRTVRVSVSRV